MKHVVRIGVGFVVAMSVLGWIGHALHVDDLPFGLGEVLWITAAIVLTSLFDREFFWGMRDG